MWQVDPGVYNRGVHGLKEFSFDQLTHASTDTPFFQIKPPSPQQNITAMPRNGDGSSDNGPVEGGNVIHGNSGDVYCLPCGSVEI